MTFRENLGTLANKTLRPVGAEIRPLRISGTTTPWESSSAFLGLFKKIREHTMMSPSRLYVLWQFAQYASSLKYEGDFAELGVWRGG